MRKLLFIGCFILAIPIIAYGGDTYTPNCFIGVIDEPALLEEILAEFKVSLPDQKQTQESIVGILNELSQIKDEAQRKSLEAKLNELTEQARNEQRKYQEKIADLNQEVLLHPFEEEFYLPAL
ncbi:MAG: hypothetical protein ACPLSN_09405, partial [Dictyoglomus turgidum]